MDPSEAREQLLSQHDHLRQLLADAVATAAAVLAGKPASTELAERLEELRLAFVEHNDFEQSVLEPVLRQGDAWAPKRVARMIEEHAAEHAAFAAFFAGSVLEMARGLGELAEQVDAHMAAEERTFLSPAVLPGQRGRKDSSSPP
jgi:hypothetical protein